jgi:hypothetical protein
MLLNTFLFTCISFATVISYYFIGNKVQWSQRSIVTFSDAYWQASQIIVWALAAVLLRNGPTISGWTLLPILPTAILYGFITEIKDMRFDLESSFTPIQITVLVLVGLTVLFYVSILLMFLDLSVILFYFVPILLFLGWVFTWTKIPDQSDVQVNNKKTTNHYKFHLHHWIIALAGFLISKADRIFSDIGAGIFWGIFCQEIASYGIAIPVDIQSRTPPSAG